MHFSRWIIVSLLVLMLGALSVSSVALAHTLQQGAIDLQYPDDLQSATAQRVIELQQEARNVVVDLLDVQHSGVLQIYVETDCAGPEFALFGRPYAWANEIHYCLPPPALASRTRLERELSRTMIHETVHAVHRATFYDEGQSRVLEEGLAMAVESIHSGRSGADTLQILAQGLIRSDLFVDLDALLAGMFDDDLYVYWQSGSFIRYLIESFGMSRLRDFFERADEIVYLKDVTRLMRDIYGQPLSEIESDWRRSLTADINRRDAQRADRFVDAFFYRRSEERSLMRDLDQLYRFAQRLQGVPRSQLPEGVDPFTYIQALPERLYRTLHNVREQYARLRTVPIANLEAGFQQYKRSIDQWVDALGRWRQAAETFQWARHLLREGAEKSRILRRLYQARWLYDSVGDVALVAKVTDYIEAVRYADP